MKNQSTFSRAHKSEYIHNPQIHFILIIIGELDVLLTNQMIIEKFAWAKPRVGVLLKYNSYQYKKVIVWTHWKKMLELKMLPNYLTEIVLWKSLENLLLCIKNINRKSFKITPYSPNSILNIECAHWIAKIYCLKLRLTLVFIFLVHRKLELNIWASVWN